MKTNCKAFLLTGGGKIGYSNLLKAFLSLALITTASCSDETDNFAQEGTPLQVNINTAAVMNRAVIESATLPDGHAVGLSLVDDAGSKYDNVSYQNIKATASTGKVPQTWSLEADMMLSATSGSLYGYYPYSSAVADITQIPVTAGDTDYMYATPVQGLDNGNYNAAVTMNHALAAIRLNIVRGTYTGTGSVTAVSVKGDNIATAASLDAKTGILTSFTGAGTAVSKTTAFTLSATSTQIDHIIVPVTGISTAPVFTVTMDGAEYTATPSAVTLQQGCIYQYTLKIDNTGISMAGIEVGDWEYSENGNLVIDAGYKITLAGNMEDILLNYKVNDDKSVIIKANSADENMAVDNIDYTEGVNVGKQTNPNTGIVTYTLTDITRDVTLYFNGICQGYEDLIVNVEGLDAGFTIYVKDEQGNIIGSQTTVTKTYKVIAGTKYYISASGFESYVIPQDTEVMTAVKFKTREITMTYTEHPGTLNPANGVYIQDTDGFCHTADEWTGEYTANGIAVVTSNCSFVMALTEASTSKGWGGFEKTVSGIMTTVVASTAITDYAGDANTTQIINQLKGKIDSEGITGAPAAEACRAFTFPNGKNGYLGAMGEWQSVLDNRIAVETALSKCGGTAMSINYWTSTQGSGTVSWAYKQLYDSIELNNKFTSCYVRAFTTLN